MTFPTATILVGDVRARLAELPDESVQCVITSPPYHGLRSYLPAGHPDKSLELGLEPTVGEYIATMVDVFRAVRRVLRPDGVVWLNIGDRYNNRAKIRPSSHQPSLNGYEDTTWGKHAANGHTRMSQIAGDDGLKEKDLCLIPFRLVIALQDDGWYVRSDCIWAKPNAMPSSATDRPTVAHEYVFLLSRGAHYHYDAEAIRTPAKSDVPLPAVGGWASGDTPHDAISHNQGEQQAMGANQRTVWWMATQGTRLQHYATFPEALVEICLLSGTSERGACAACGAPWRREMEIIERAGHKPRLDELRFSGGSGEQRNDVRRFRGWEPTCRCVDAGEPRPCVVLDPFVGSGTTALVALRHGRSCIGIELSEQYASIARDRITADAPLFNRVEVA